MRPVVVALVLFPATLLAQLVEPFTRLRVKAPTVSSRFITGALIAASNDTLVLAPDDWRRPLVARDERLSIPMNAVESVDRGVRSDHAMTGGMIGVGVVAALAIGCVIADQRAEVHEMTGICLVGGILTSLPAFQIGALLGMPFPRTAWTRVYPSRR